MLGKNRYNLFLHRKIKLLYRQGEVLASRLQNRYLLRFTVDSTGGILVGGNYQGSDAPANGAAIEGNVGIGTTSPGAKLDIRSATDSNAIFIREDTDNSVTHNFWIDSLDNGNF